MANVPAKISTGVDLIDRIWGGMYQGGAYMVYGRPTSGRGLLPMLFLRTGVLQGETGLFVSPGRPNDWAIQAASVDFDLEQARRDGRVAVVWMPSASAVPRMDEAQSVQAVTDLIELAARRRPGRLVINDFMPFMQFRSFGRFRQIFSYMIQEIGDTGTTLMLTMAEPVNLASRQIVEFMKSQVTGSVAITLPGDPADEPEDEPAGALPPPRLLALLPGLGHGQHFVREPWQPPNALPPAAVDLEAGDGSAKNGVHPTRRTVPGRPRRRPTAVPVGSGALAAGAGTAAEVLPAPHEAEHVLERAALQQRLELLFRKRATDGTPFLLAAIRMDEGARAAAPHLGFSSLVHLAARSLRDEDRLYVCSEEERLVLLMEDSPPNAVHAFFSALRRHLEAEAPDEADALLQHVSAIVVPDGLPFRNAEELLSYALSAD